jgi:hypothetical protein
MLPADRRLILSDWSKTVLGVSRSTPRGVGPLSQMKRGRYFDAQERLIDQILGLPTTKTMIATTKDSPDHVIGWIVADPSLCLLHLVYVSHNLRRFGVGSSLMRSVFADLGSKTITATHWTRVLPCYFEKWRLEYDPFVLYRIA